MMPGGIRSQKNLRLCLVNESTQWKMWQQLPDIQSVDIHSLSFVENSNNLLSKMKNCVCVRKADGLWTVCGRFEKKNQDIKGSQTQSNSYAIAARNWVKSFHRNNFWFVKSSSRINVQIKSRAGLRPSCIGQTLIWADGEYNQQSETKIEKRKANDRITIDENWTKSCAIIFISFLVFCKFSKNKNVN